jgi:undecaprenyl-diphosphatase
MDETSQLISAFLLGILEGITEFLPISSTGHLILAIEMFGIETPPGKVFEVVIQLGAIFAVCWYYRQKLWNVTTRLHKPDGRHFALLLVVGFIPAGIVGATLHGFIKEVLFSPLVVAVMLIVGGIIIWLIERRNMQPVIHTVDELSYTRAFFIGCFQALAVIPGTSRSGSTIVGGLLLGLERKTAAEFSFFLAIPTMLGATVYDLYKNYALLSTDGWEMIAIGFVSAFIAAILSVSFLLNFISKHGFIPFAIYRILVGALMLWWFL